MRTSHLAALVAALTIALALPVSAADADRPAVDGAIRQADLQHDSRDDLYRAPVGAVPAGTAVHVRLRAAAGDGQLPSAGSFSELPLCSARPEMGRDRRDRESLLRKVYGRGQHLAHRQSPCAIDQVTPACAGAGHRDRMGVIRRQIGSESLLRQQGQ